MNLRTNRYNEKYNIEGFSLKDMINNESGEKRQKGLDGFIMQQGVYNYI